jgi:hypothetical protein
VLQNVLAEFFEAGAGEGSVEIDTFVKRVDFNRSLCGRREGALGTFAGSSETTESVRVRENIFLVLALEPLDKKLTRRLLKSSPPR